MSGKSFWPDAAVARAKYLLSEVLREKAGCPPEEELPEATALSVEAKDVLSKLLPFDPVPVKGVAAEDAMALFDHLQPVFGGRFTGTKLLRYVGKPVEAGSGS